MNRLFPFLILAVLFCTPSFAQAQSTVYGYDLRTRDNVVTFSVDNPADISTIVKNYSAFALDFDATGTLYAIDSFTDTIGTIDVTTGFFTSGPQVTGGAGAASGLAFDPSQNQFYACTTTNLYTIDETTGVSTLIAPITGLDPASTPIGSVVDISIDNDGTLYCFDLTADALWSVDKTTGNATWLAAPNIGNVLFAQGMDFDPVTNTLYQAIYAPGTPTIGSYGTWNLVGTPTFTEILPLSSFPVDVELEVALFDGVTYGFNVQQGRRTLVSFPQNDPAALMTLAYRNYDTFAMDFDDTTSVLWAFDNQSLTVGTIDLATACYTSVAPIGGDFPSDATNASGLTFDASLGMFFISRPTELYMLDNATGSATLVGAFVDTNGVPVEEMIDISVNTTGDMYGFDIETDSLFSIDKATGICTFVGMYPFGDARFAQGMDFDPATDTLYSSIYTGSGTGSYGTWDLVSGLFTEIVDLPSFPDPIGTGYELEIAILAQATGGCVDPVDFTRFRGFDIGTPTVGDFAGPDGTAASYNPGFTINDTEAPIWLIFDYTAASTGEIQVTSQAGTPGLEMTAEYFDGTSFVVVGTATETFNTFSTETFSLGGVSTNQVRIGWRQVGFTINFPWTVNVDAVGLCN